MKGYEDIKMLQDAEDIADAVWLLVSKWDHFARDTVAKQWVRATDSIGANIAEAFGRFHYGEKINFLYYARGSTFECKYWLNRALKRDLITIEAHGEYAAKLTEIAKQINGFAGSLKTRRSSKESTSSLREGGPIYSIDDGADETAIFSELQLDWILTNVNTDAKTLHGIRTDPRHSPNP